MEIMEYYASLGFVFNPTDVQICDHILRNKARGSDFIRQEYGNSLPDVHVYGEHPKKLFKPDGENYFFTKLAKLSANRISRQVKGGIGTWKPDKTVTVEDDGGRLLGKKRSLSYMEGGTKCSHWNMDEYTLPDWKDEDWVFCKVRYNGKDDQQARVEDGSMANSFALVEARPESRNLEFAPVPRIMHDQVAPSAGSVQSSMHGVVGPSAGLVQSSMHGVGPSAGLVQSSMHGVGPSAGSVQSRMHGVVGPSAGLVQSSMHGVGPSAGSVQSSMHGVVGPSAGLVQSSMHGVAPSAGLVPRNMHGVTPSVGSVPRNMHGAAPSANLCSRNMQPLAPPAGSVSRQQMPDKATRVVDDFVSAVKRWVPSESCYQDLDEFVKACMGEATDSILG